MLDLEHICQFAGILTIIGAMFLIFNEKIYLDAETKKVVSVELPFFGKVKTNAPTLAVIVMGFAAVVYPVYLSHTTYITVKQEVDSDSPLTVNAYAVSKQATVGNNKHLTIKFPNLSDGDYQPHLVLHAGSAFWDEEIDKDSAHHGVIMLDKAVLQDIKPQPSAQEVTAARPEGYK